ncbi:tetratricopeptide repeat-containing hybrid sensor histidine kinase/response regulator [Robertkochia solimangrovi]|uniref:tetratricopeptide repeat-containing hybrid sensor histidine kinase/response regulator n=1 Tax=Robertkochia solimangrovi TaxID=2213046 RepID=UPI00117E7880|nr:response regulator [Robertkochia solimangrovi]TRZ41435.1 hybrid sensor histidine kinase/response regulator [Robertkochia solimangrovi]
MRLLVLIILYLALPLSMAAQDDLIYLDSLQKFKHRFYDLKNQGDYEGAKEAYNKAWDIATFLERDRIIIDLYNLNTILNLEFNYLKNAESGIKLTDVDFSEVRNYKEGKALSAILEGVIYAKQGNKAEARKKITEAEGHVNALDPSLLNTNIIYVIEYYKAVIHMELDDLDIALKEFSRITQSSHEFEKEFLRARTYLNMAGIYLEKDNLESARYQLQNAEQVAENYGYFKVLRETHLMTAKLLKSQGNFEEALVHFQKADSIQEAYFNPLALIDQRYAASEDQIDMLTQRLQQREKDVADYEEEEKISKLTSVLSSALLIIISLLTISLYRNNQIKFKTNDLLLKKNNELQLAKEEAEKAMKAKSQFLSTVSHELRTPLYAVTGLTHLLLEEDPKESQKEHLNSLKFSGEYLLEFINDILQINKIDANKLVIENVEFDLRKVLGEVCKSLHQTAKENNNTIVLEVHDSIPDKLIGDPLKLSQIFINLVGNALKFTDNGKVTIVANPVKMDKDQYTIHFEVNDEGIGISKEMQENIFESFSQGSVQINRKYGGTGLGLTIVKSLIGLFNSKIEVKSDIGEGSSFYFNIDFKLVEYKEKTKVKDIIPEDLSDDFFSELHILVVEDNKINQVITQKMLSKKGMSCDIANNGYEAIDRAKATAYDLILMDIHMPGISGLKATEQIREFNKTVPIIALTAISLDESTEDFFAIGCTDVITKPFKPDTFYNAIAKAVSKSKTALT